jgi:signal transduction histidine kinase
MVQEYYDRLGKSELKGMIGDINTSGKRLITIVNDFLDVSRIEQGRIVVELEAVAADLLVRDVVKELAGVAKAHGLTLRVADGSSRDVMMRADRDRTKQILFNVIGNAIKYTDRGGVTVGVQTVGSSAVLSVSDTGKGIPKDSQYLLFRKFQQASNNTLTRDNSQSTGLGLYISKKLAKAMKGDLYLEHSTPDEGTVFALRLPLAKG